MSLAQRVRDYRYSKGWGPDELASRAEISRTALYQIESGKTELPRAGTLRRIAMALEVPMETLLGTAEVSPVPLANYPSPQPERKPQRSADWIPSEGGALHTPSSPSGQAGDNGEALRFGVESRPNDTTSADGLVRLRERDLAWKLHELLDSPLGEGVARIVEESYRMLPQARITK